MPAGGQNKIEMIGKIFQGIRVLSESERSSCGQLCWECQCICGKIFKADGHSLRRGQRKSCGCLTYVNQKTHDMHKTKIYKVWSGMISRCRTPSNTAYKNYGAKGVTVCEDWLKFENFYRDMGDPPFDRATLDRIDYSLGYCKDNVRWASYFEQSRNKSTNRLITYKGKTLCLADWAKELGLDKSTLSHRLQRWGAIEKPSLKRG